MLQHDKPEDFVIATNEAHSIREFVEAAFKHVGVDIVWVLEILLFCFLYGQYSEICHLLQLSNMNIWY